MVSFSFVPPKAKELTQIKACHSLCFRIHTSTLASVSGSFRFVSVATDRRNIPTQVSDNPFVFATRLESASGLYAISNTQANANNERQALRSLPFKCYQPLLCFSTCLFFFTESLTVPLAMPLPCKACAQSRIVFFDAAYCPSELRFNFRSRIRDTPQWCSASVPSLGLPQLCCKESFRCGPCHGRHDACILNYICSKLASSERSPSTSGSAASVCEANHSESESLSMVEKKAARDAAKKKKRCMLNCRRCARED